MPRTPRPITPWVPAPWPPATRPSANAARLLLAQARMGMGPKPPAAVTTGRPLASAAGPWPPQKQSQDLSQ